VYASVCVTCHGERLEGVDGPALAGPGAAVLDFRTGRRLFDYVATYMPDDAQGSLSEREYLEATVFLMHANGVNPGGQVGVADLDSISLQ
jgi:mono/diheme cytochrome c family protein